MIKLSSKAKYLRTPVSVWLTKQGLVKERNELPGLSSSTMLSITVFFSFHGVRNLSHTRATSLSRWPRDVRSFWAAREKALSKNWKRAFF